METARILIVEDEAVVALDLKMRLLRMGYAITGTAAYGTQAIDLAAADPPDLILMDINIKGKINGIETALRIIEQRSVPVVFLTAHSDQDTLSQAKAANPYGYLVKPFDEKSLQTTIEMAVYKHRMERQLQREKQKLIASEAEQERLRIQLFQAHKMEAIGTLAGGIAHNFNNLLMGIGGNASLLNLELGEDNPLAVRMDTIEDLVQKGAKLTQQLLDYARRGDSQVEAIDLVKAVRETAATFATTRKEVRVVVDIADNMIWIMADANQICQVILNLCINAAEAMPAGGLLEIALNKVFRQPEEGLARMPGHYAHLVVRDHGHGMDQQTASRIFEPFFTTKEMGRGTGLALSSVYGIIQKHKGHIEVHSQPGVGTAFTIHLPMMELATAKVPADGPALADQTKDTILIVDDEPMVLNVAKDMLHALNYRVVTAASGREAVQQFTANKERICLVVLDMIMPEMGGDETFDRLRQIDPAVVVLLASGYGIDGQASDIVQKGCGGFIQKPFRLDEFSRQIKKLFAPPK